MKDFVADASVGISWAVPSQSTEVTDRLLDDIASGSYVIVPPLWFLEVANSLLVLAKRSRINAEQSLKARQYLSELRLRVDDCSAGSAFQDIYQLAESNALTIYDAVYLELAIRCGVPLATRDARLKRVAQAYVETLS